MYMALLLIILDMIKIVAFDKSWLNYSSLLITYLMCMARLYREVRVMKEVMMLIYGTENVYDSWDSY